MSDDTPSPEESEVPTRSGAAPFAGPSDPKLTGWHRLEYLLWKKNTTTGAAAYADRLDADLATLKSGVATLEIPPLAMAQGPRS